MQATRPALLFGSLLVLVALVAAASAGTMRDTRTVYVTLSVVPNTPRLVVRFNLTNPSTKSVEAPLNVLTWGTPMEGVMGPIFAVSDVFGNDVSYVGKFVRRAWPPSASSYISLRPRESSVIEVDLTDDFDFPGAGDYLVRFISPQFQDNIVFISTDEVVGRLPVINRRAVPPHHDENRLGNTNCDSTKNSQIATAVKGAMDESLAAYNCLNKKTCETLSTRWFGAYSKDNYDYDTATFQKVYNRLKDFTFNAYCNPAGCGNDVYAYVYPTDKTYTVYLCGAFWNQADERVNTVVHEMSHFSTLGGTDDYAYGKKSCLSLAKSNPYRASHNADNVCYFSEEAAKAGF